VAYFKDFQQQKTIKMGKVLKYLAIAIALAIPLVVGYLDQLEFWNK